MNNLETLGFMPEDYVTYTTCVDSMPFFGMLSILVLIIAIIILVITAINNKSKFKIPIIVLAVFLSIIGVVGALLSISLSSF